jgi:lipoyl-dependent peroxiredoxin
MAEFSRHVDVEWNGGIMDGKGTAKAGTGAFTLPVTFPSRIGESEGRTSPEELIAAAHAACFAMALNATLGRKGGKAATTHVTATVTADKGDSGIKIVSSKLVVKVTGLEGIDSGQFGDIARQAEQACPVSNALRNNLRIDVESSVG